MNYLHTDLAQESYLPCLDLSKYEGLGLIASAPSNASSKDANFRFLSEEFFRPVEFTFAGEASIGAVKSIRRGRKISVPAKMVFKID